MNVAIKGRQWATIGFLLCLVIAACFGVFLTRQMRGPAEPAGFAQSQSLVDQSPLLLARSAAALANNAEQQHLSEEALRLADHEVDLAFADALRNAAENPVAPNPETRQLSIRLDQARSRQKADQDLANQLKKKISASPERERDSLQQQLDLLQAQLELDQDEVEDAQEDVSRAGGDPKSRIQRLLDEHEASAHQANTTSAARMPDAPNAASNLLRQVSAWRALRLKQQELETAKNESLAAAEYLSKAHDQLEKRVEAEKANSGQVPESATNPARASQGQRNSGETSSALSSLRRLSGDQKNLSSLDKRIEDHQELAQVYASWIVIVVEDRRIALNGLIQSSLWILLIVLFAYLISRVLDQVLLDAGAEKRKLRTIRTVSRFALQAVALLLVLVVIFGTPSQTPTILGLAGAGLTVALKDFIVAFFGWFVLMGRNGLRVGDWVEINGVVGEVSEIGVLRTVLFETGNWNDAGHPTGRKVAFVNSFAIEGHFFNFSTTGQWLWDELQVLVPANENPYPLIDAIQKLVTDETAAAARAAEEEWQRATSRQRLGSVSAAPAINVRPTSSGVQVLVRYITRAHERYEVRARLYQAIVDLLHRKKASHVTVGTSSGKAN